MRYTEARLAAISTEMLADIDKETVDWMPNYDNRHQQPTVLPARVPNLIVNGSAGIAVGMATNIPPHNLREIVAATKRLIDDPELTTDDLCETVVGPDFPGGGVIYRSTSSATWRQAPRSASTPSAVPTRRVAAGSSPARRLITSSCAVTATPSS